MFTAAQIPASALAYGLKLSDAQKSKVEAAQKPYLDFEKGMRDAAEARAKANHPPEDEGARQYRTLVLPQKLRELQKQADADINAVLTDSQKAALPGFLDKISRLGIAPDIYADLKLSADQETRLLDAADKGVARTREIRAAGRQSGQMDRDALRKSHLQLEANIDAVLTPEQKSIRDAYKIAHPIVIPGIVRTP